MPTEADTVAHSVNCQSLSTFCHNGQMIGFTLGHTCGLLLDITQVRPTHLLPLIFSKAPFQSMCLQYFQHLDLSTGCIELFQFRCSGQINMKLLSHVGFHSSSFFQLGAPEIAKSTLDLHIIYLHVCIHVYIRTAISHYIMSIMFNSSKVALLTKNTL